MNTLLAGYPGTDANMIQTEACPERRKKENQQSKSPPSKGNSLPVMVSPRGTGSDSTTSDALIANSMHVNGTTDPNKGSCGKETHKKVPW